VWLALCTSCKRGAEPEAGLRAFLAAAAAGDHDAAFARLSKATQAEADRLVAVARPILMAAGETVPADGKAFLFGQGLDLVREVDRIEALDKPGEKEGSVAHLKVTDTSGQVVVLEMRLEGGKWRLHLPLSEGAPDQPGATD